MVREGSNGTVTAAKVIDIFPHFQSLPLDLISVENEHKDYLEEKLPIYDKDGLHYLNSKQTIRDLDDKVKELKTKYYQNNG